MAQNTQIIHNLNDSNDLNFSGNKRLNKSEFLKLLKSHTILKIRIT